eukprot:2946206-Amphidinium_carterae.3
MFAPWPLLRIGQASTIQDRRDFMFGGGRENSQETMSNGLNPKNFAQAQSPSRTCYISNDHVRMSGYRGAPPLAAVLVVSEARNAL